MGERLEPREVLPIRTAELAEIILSEILRKLSQVVGRHDLHEPMSLEQDPDYQALQSLQEEWLDHWKGGEPNPETIYQEAAALVPRLVEQLEKERAEINAAREEAEKRGSPEAMAYREAEATQAQLLRLAQDPSTHAELASFARQLTEQGRSLLEQMSFYEAYLNPAAFCEERANALKGALENLKAILESQNRMGTTK